MRISILLFLLYQVNFIKAQDTLFFEDFESTPKFVLNSNDLGSSTNGYNSWIVNNAYYGGSGTLFCMGFPFSYTINNTASQPISVKNSPNSYYLHTISDEAIDDNIYNSNFMAADGTCFFSESNFAKMDTGVSFIGRGDSVTISFWWNCGGGQNIHGELYYSTNGGVSWNQITNPITLYKNQTTWIQNNFKFTILNMATQNNVRFAFRFANITSSSAQFPGFSIDDFTITADTIRYVPIYDTVLTCVNYVFNGDTLTSGGNYVDTALNTDSNYYEIQYLNLTIGSNNSDTISVTSCDSILSPSGKFYLTNSGIYLDTIQDTTTSCDSLFVINFLLDSLNLTVNQNSNTLTSNDTSATYQWIDCSNGDTLITGETNQVFIATSNGDYGVIISKHGCTDTSACVTVATTFLNEKNEQSIRVYPNPSNGIYQLSGINTNTDVAVLNAVGQIIYQESITGNIAINLSRFNNGVYLLKINQQHYTKTIKLVKK